MARQPFFRGFLGGRRVFVFEDSEMLIGLLFPALEKPRECALDFGIAAAREDNSPSGFSEIIRVNPRAHVERVRPRVDARFQSVALWGGIAFRGYHCLDG